MSGLLQSSIKSLPLVYRGKVRDSYAVGNDKLLIVTTDRLSAFDVVMSEPIPDKGKVLNAMSNFWFERLAHVTANHLTGIAPESAVANDEVGSSARPCRGRDEAEAVASRSRRAGLPDRLGLEGLSAHRQCLWN